MKFFAAIFVLSGLFCSVRSQQPEKPEWVRLYQLGLALPDSGEYYIGMGSSSLTQEEADGKARQDFALSVEVCIQNEIVHEKKESDNYVREEYIESARMSSDVVLRGIAITGRYEDRAMRKYYSIIRMNKSVFDTLLATEIRRDLERKRAVNRVREEEKEEDLRSRQAFIALKQKEEEARKKELELERQQYADFLSLAPPDQVIDLRNGEIARKGLTVAARMSLAPFDVQSAYIVLAFWHVEISAFGYFNGDRMLKTDMLRREQASLKVQLLDRAGRIYKTSLSFGVVAHSTVSSFGALDSVAPTYSACVSGDVALPDVISSYVSGYADGRKACIGINSFPFPGTFKDAVSLLLQMDYVWNKAWRNRFQDPVLIQTGIRLRASDSFATSFAYENHEFFVFTVEMGL
jgi:hypothetical protein